jgi:hypothetical protein
MRRKKASKISESYLLYLKKLIRRRREEKLKAAERKRKHHRNGCGMAIYHGVAAKTRAGGGI